MTLKQQIEDDVKNILMNTDEFAVTAEVQGYDFPIVIDDRDEMIIVNQFTSSGIVQNITRVYFADQDWPVEVTQKPRPNLIMTMDRGNGRERLQIDKCDLESGMWKVDLKTMGNSYGL